MNKQVFPAKCIQFVDTSRYSNSLAYFEISNQNHNHQTGCNYGILWKKIHETYMETPKIWGLKNSHGLF